MSDESIADRSVLPLDVLHQIDRICDVSRLFLRPVEERHGSKIISNRSPFPSDRP